MTQTTREKVLLAIQPYDPKEHPAGTFRMNSPFRPGSNSHALTLTIRDEEHGAWLDFVSGESGSLYDFAEKMGIEIARQQVPDSKRVYAGLADYATSHGITADVLTAAGWTEESVYDGSDDFKCNRPALTFPTASGRRIRFIDGKKPSYKSIVGYTACWYGLDKALAIIRQDKQPLVVCNGEISTVVAQHFGIAACAVTSGEKKLPAHLLTELKNKWAGEIILAFDCDATGQRVAKEIHEQLPGAVIADLGLSTGGDLADLCKLYTTEAKSELHKRAVAVPKEESAVSVNDLAALVKQLVDVRRAEEKPELDIPTLLAQIDREIGVVRSKSQLAPVVTVAEMVNENEKRLLEVMQNPGYRGLLSKMHSLDKMVGSFVGGRIHMLYGATNMGKSTLAVSLAREFIMQAPGLVVPTEMPPNAWIDKLTSCICKIPFDVIEEGRLDAKELERVKDTYQMLRNRQLSIMKKVSPTPGDLMTEIRAHAERGYKWVLIDSISKLQAPGTSGIFDRMTEVANTIQDLAIETGMTFIVTSQVGRQVVQRSNKAPVSEDAYGSGSIEQNADVILSLYNHNHYVELGMAQADPHFPMDSCLVRQTKHRWRAARSLSVLLTMVNGAGFYELQQQTNETVPVRPLEMIPTSPILNISSEQREILF